MNNGFYLISGRYAAMALLMVLGIIMYSCKSTPSVDCHFFDDQGNPEPTNPWPYDEDEEPPCDCKDESGILISPAAGTGSHFTVTTCSQCEQELSASYCTGIGTTPTEVWNVTNPYTPSNHTTTQTVNDYILPEFQTYYFDNVGPYDNEHRYVYFEFNLLGLDVANDVLQFKIKKGTEGVDYVTVDLKTCGCATTIRRFVQYDPGGGLVSQGTVKMDIQTAGFNGSGSYSIGVYLNGASVAMAASIFNVVFNQTGPDNTSYSQRQWKLMPLESSNLNFTSYQMDGVDWETGLSNVFGGIVKDADKSGIVINSLPALPITPDLVDFQDDIMLNSLDLNWNGSTANLVGAGDAWLIRVNAHPAHQIPNNYDFVSRPIAVNFIKSYDFPAQTINADNGVIVTEYNNALGTTLGQSFEDNSGFFYSICLTWGKNIQTIHQAQSYNSAVTLKAMTIAVMYHELGHAWVENSKAGPGTYDFTGNQCPYHTNYCSGVNKEYCLWQYCDKSGTASTLVTFFNSNVSNPKFCETHQQIFLNQLIPLH